MGPLISGLVANPVASASSGWYNQRWPHTALAFGTDGKLTSGEPFDPATADFADRFEYDAKRRQVLAVSFEGALMRLVYDGVRSGQLLPQRVL
jgi:hypothetical protein